MSRRAVMQCVLSHAANSAHDALCSPFPQSYSYRHRPRVVTCADVGAAASPVNFAPCEAGLRTSTGETLSSRRKAGPSSGLLAVSTYSETTNSKVRCTVS